jgi:uncharacterized protein with FMN-binding domain
MKRVLAAATLTLAGLAALLGFKTRDLAGATTTTTGGGNTTTSAGATTTSSAGATTTTAGSGGTTTTAGTVQTDGPTVGTPYGPVQVSVVVTNGQIVDVVALQLPGGNRESDQINAYAEPQLREMALQAQSANIDVVSGATFTSRAYAESLQGALDAAGL